MSEFSIDFNVDCGEGFGKWSVGNDAELLKHVTSASIACGGHAGDGMTMRNTVLLCRDFKVMIGAHPGFNDKEGFGRRMMLLTADEIHALIVSQTGALMAIAACEGMQVRYVKPHGALFNMACEERAVAVAVAAAVARLDPTLMLYALAGSELMHAGEAAGLRVVCEVYGDRAYMPDGSLVPRREPNSIIEDNMQCLNQIVHAVKDGYIVTRDGSFRRVTPHSVCLHGDTPGAPARAAYLARGLRVADIGLRAPPNKP
jgi:5-oxoprolinase (ATP-hydrolysing) subunit A